jgi:hypothetical protein
MKANKLSLAIGLCTLSISGAAFAGAFIFAGEGNEDRVAHPSNYTGTGGVVTVEVCIAPGTPNEAAMVIPVQNIVNTINTYQAVQPNLTSANVPFGEYDFESVALHEVGHCIGLAHPNLGSQSENLDPDRGPIRVDPVSGTDTELTNAADGADDLYTRDYGVDGIPGTADDGRGDDVNLHWFFIGENNPFVRSSADVDSSTYSRDLADLPMGDSFPINASDETGPGLGFPNTEAVMQQGSPNGQAQRDFSVDDIATLDFARSGVDRSAGTGDDYTIQAVYGGVKSGCDVNLAFDDARTGFAVCSVGGTFVGANQIAITTGNAYFDPDVVTWFFNDQPNQTDDTIFSDRFEVL